jgi:hypothetical protein
MAVLYKIDNSIYIEDLNGSKFDIALNGAFFYFDNKALIYNIFNKNTAVKAVIKRSDIPSYFNDSAVAYTESTLLAFLRLNTGASASGGSSSLTLYGLSTNDFNNDYKSQLDNLDQNILNISYINSLIL